MIAFHLFQCVKDKLTMLCPLQVVYEQYKLVQLKLPYIPGFLAFREVGFLVELIDELKRSNPALVPQLIFVDGNGYLHPRGRYRRRNLVVALILFC